MRKIALLLTLIFSISFLISCKESAPVEKPAKVEVKPEPKVDLVAVGKGLFTTKTCTSCHSVDVKLIGPAVQDIAKTYKAQKADLVAFFKGESKAIVDPAMAAIMDANVQSITKPMSDDDLKALSAYINSTIK